MHRKVNGMEIYINGKAKLTYMLKSNLLKQIFSIIFTVKLEA